MIPHFPESFIPLRYVFPRFSLPFSLFLCVSNNFLLSSANTVDFLFYFCYNLSVWMRDFVKNLTSSVQRNAAFGSALPSMALPFDSAQAAFAGTVTYP